jgi:hypothetical protein
MVSTTDYPRLAVVGAILFLSMGADCRSFGTEPVESQNLLQNGSFERTGEASLDGWRIANAMLTSTAKEAPPHGGLWSLKLAADWAPTTGFVTAAIPEARNGDILQLSAYVRALPPYGGGTIGLLVGEDSFQIPRHAKWVSTTDTVWTYLSLIDTLSMGEDDSVWVRLSSLATEVTAREGLFDLVSLERLER